MVVVLEFVQNLAEKLSDSEQAEKLNPEDLEQYQNAAHSLGMEFILKHKDKDVRLYAASCLADVLRVFAPDAPYSKSQLQVSGILMFQSVPQI